MIKYVKRTNPPTKTNIWYKDPAHGGVSNCTTDIPNPRFPGSTTNNCIGYNWGRYWEAQAINGELFGAKTKAELQTIFAKRPHGDPDKAWYTLKASGFFGPYCKDTPKRGSIAFYERVPANAKFNGHVSFVEEVKSNTKVDFSNNNLTTKPLFKYYDDVNPYGNFGKYRLLGYLWPIADFEGETYKTTDPLNCRKTPGGEIVGTFAKGATVELAGDHKDHGGHVWKCVTGKDRTGKTISGFVRMDFLM